MAMRAVAPWSQICVCARESERERKRKKKRMTAATPFV